jgi:hypothetical protein
VKGAAIAIGGQLLAGVALGFVWVALSPRPKARWLDVLWYAEDQIDFSAVQDVRFGLISLVPGVIVGIALTAWAARPGALARAASWGAGAIVGSGAMWLTGLLVTGAFGAAPATDAVERVPVTLTSPGMALIWPLMTFLIPALYLAFRSLFTRPS